MTEGQLVCLCGPGQMGLAHLEHWVAMAGQKRAQPLCSALSRLPPGRGAIPPALTSLAEAIPPACTSLAEAGHLAKCSSLEPGAYRPAAEVQLVSSLCERRWR